MEGSDHHLFRSMVGPVRVTCFDRFPELVRVCTLLHVTDSNFISACQLSLKSLIARLHAHTSLDDFSRF